MNPLFIILALFVIVIIALPLLRTYKTKINSDQMNVAIYKTQIEELQRDLDNGLLDAEQHAISLEELKNSLGKNLDMTEQKTNSSGNILGLALVGALVFSISFFVYQQVDTSTIQSQQAQQGKETPSLETLIARLEDKLKEQPKNSQGWQILARTYEATDRPKEAVDAYRNAIKYQEKEDPTLLVKLGYALAVSQKGDFNGEPITLFQKAAKLDPNNHDSRYLIGRYYFANGKFQEALTAWKALLPLLSPADKKPVQDDISIAQQKLGITPTVSKATESAAVAKAITVQVTIDSSIVAQPNETVFISAHAKNGPPMPLAAKKMRVSDFPATIKLDKSMAVIPNMNIENFNDIIVKARISKSGDALLQSGDRTGRSGVVNFNQTVHINIINITP